jgi:predicted DNA-binding transcriptional regulator AlpA
MFSITEFCEYSGISRSFYYALQRNGAGPAETRIGARVMIAKDTAHEWLKSHEMASQARKAAA